MNKVERRYNQTEFRVIQDEGKPTKVVGYASVFNSKSDDLGGFIEEIDSKAFDNVLKTNPDVRALWNHNPDVVLGRTASGTLRLSKDKKGLAYEVDMPDTQAAKDLMTLMQRGDVNQSSFAFIPKLDSWTEQDGVVVRTILEMDSLLDVSPVTYPAYPDATSGVRSYPSSMPVEIRSKLQKRDGEAHTKHVDGEDLTADCFLLVGDPTKTDTWALPWKFSTEEKTKSHLRNALARFDQVKGFSQEEMDKAKEKLHSLCAKYGIEVSDDEKKSIRSKKDDTDDTDDTDSVVDSEITDDTDTTDDSDDEEVCSCNCEQCSAGACNICSNDDCADETCSCYNQERSWMHMQLELAKAKVSTY